MPAGPLGRNSRDGKTPPSLCLQQSAQSSFPSPRLSQSLRGAGRSCNQRKGARFTCTLCKSNDRTSSKDTYDHTFSTVPTPYWFKAARYQMRRSPNTHSIPHSNSTLYLECWSSSAPPMVTGNLSSDQLASLSSAPLPTVRRRHVTANRLCPPRLQ